MDVTPKSFYSGSKNYADQVKISCSIILQSILNSITTVILLQLSNWYKETIDNDSETSSLDAAMMQLTRLISTCYPAFSSQH